MRRLLRAARARIQKLRARLTWRLRRQRVARDIGPIAPIPPRDQLAGATLFFVPYAGITPMFSQACVVARTLRERGHRVVFARCFRLFERCPVIDMHALPFDAPPERKLEVCLHCADNSLAMLADYGLDAIDLRALVTRVMTAALDQALIQPPADLRSFTFDGLSFGLMSSIDLILARKISELDSLSENDRRGWLQYLQSCLLGYLLVDRLCREFGIARVVHANDYSLLLGARMAARKNGVPCYGLAFPGHRNIDLRRYLVLSEIWKPFSYKLLANWPACRALALEPARVREVADDLVVRLRGAGSHIYSSAKTTDEAGIRGRLGLASDRRLIVAYTSSLDEAIAAEMQVTALQIEIPDGPQPFGNQIEWLQALTEYVEGSDDLELIVRVHPREGANKRESTSSQHLQMLREAFSISYVHCRFVWPQDPISSYDLGEAAELVLVSWSTIGLEMARLGVPVLAAFAGRNAAMPCDDFLEWVPSRAEYFEKLRELLDRPVTQQQIVRAFRWYSLSTLGLTVDLSDVVPRSDFGGLPEYKTPAEANALEQLIIGGRDVSELTVTRLRDSQRTDSCEREMVELQRQLARLIHFLMTGEDSPPDPRSERIRVLDGDLIEYRSGGRSFRRDSPMAARLARVCGLVAPEATAAGVRP